MNHFAITPTSTSRPSCARLVALTALVAAAPPAALVALVAPAALVAP